MNANTLLSLPKDGERRRPQAGDPTLRHGIQHILVCIDGSPSSAICIAYAQSLARTFGSEITLMHVMQHQDDRFGPHTTDALGWEISRQEAEARLQKWERETVGTTGRRVATRLEQGKPGERIVAVARELGADLVVLCSNEQGEHCSWELGSTAQQVLAAGRSSVLIARGNAVPPIFVAPKHILVPLDGSLRTEGVLPTAESIAREHGARLLLVHVVAEPIPSCVLVAPEDVQLARDLASRQQVQASQYLEDLRHRVGYDASLIDTCVDRQADTRQFLLELSESEQIDLIVLSAHGRTCNAARPYGSVAAHLLTHSKVSLLVLQDLPGSEFGLRSEADTRYAPPLRGAHLADST